MYKLDNLSYDSLEPVLSSDTVSYHRKHHEKYLDNLNDLLVKNNYDFKYSLEELVNHIDIFPIKDRGNILYNLGGVLNHNLYFNGIKPYGSELKGKLLDEIIKEYGSFEEFKKEFLNKAKLLVGSGYTFLVVDRFNKLKIINLPNQETPYSYDFRPIMALDLWEHSYYLDYKNKRDEYINNFFSIVDFEKINENYSL